MAKNTFAINLLTWFDQYGRHDLPWQQDINSYRVWVSEIMLQQTQVKTVIPYYQRFMQQFPEIKNLANTELDELLQLWTGLGYYARGRNLHKAAKIIANQYEGSFPTTLDEIIALPGIGRSTAGAILSIAQQQRQPILDGNVKRVLTRLFAIEGWPGNTKVTEELWKKAEQLTPKTRVADYTQGIMDFGATVCTRSKPNCEDCVFKSECKAYQLNKVADFPNRKTKSPKPIKATQFLICENTQGNVLLQRRPPSGIWGGLWSFPELEVDQNIDEYLEKRFNLERIDSQSLASFRHTFSHYHLDIHPVRIQTKPCSKRITEHDTIRWINNAEVASLGLAAPVKKLIETVETMSMEA